MGIQINGQTDTISAVDNNFSLAGNVSIGGTLTYEDVTSVDAVGLSTFNAGIQLDDSITHLGDTDTKIRFPAADTFSVETGGAERLRIGTGGGGNTIGISTTLNMVTNSEVLAVRGYSSFKSNTQVRPALYIGNEGSVTDTANALILFNQSGANRGGIGYVPNTGELRFNNQYFFTFCTGTSTLGGTERLRITQAGNIGIGTDTPGAILEVFDATSNTIVNVKSGDAGAVLNLIDNSARSSIEQNGTTLKISSDTGAEDASSDIRLQVDGSTKMLISSDGTILAGGQTSSYDGAFVNLELRNDSTTVGGSMTLVNDQSAEAGATCQIDCYQNFRSAGKIIFGRENANNWQAAAAGADSFLAFHTNNSGTEAERLRITSDGYVTKPYTPSFSSYLTSHYYFTSNTDTIIKPWTEQHDTGSDFNPTTGVFTAPVAGKYFFYVSTMLTRAGNGDFQIRIYKNGIMYVNSNDMSDAASTTYQQTTVNGIVNLSLNDTITFVTRNSTDTTSYIYQGMYTHCGGYLIG